ncbi:MAG: uracil-DNA glycosylase [Chloroflexota bacterium]|nr:uracil-DNA glycosylase [Chloroflexota bacterium]
MDSLQEIATLVEACTDCPLSRGRTKAVPGEGPSNAQVMFIGEAPGFNEDQQGRPFVGAAGHFLEELLGSAGIKRADVFITNVVKCRPPNNREPLPAEISACRKYLERQIALLQPRLVITLGRYSLTNFFPQESVSKAHGKPRKLDGVTFYPMLHPAAALHQQKYRSLIEEDFKRIPQLLKEPRESAQPAPPSVQQPKLF